jgi:hypothetical protein
MVFEENLNYDGQRGISNSFAIFFLRVVRTRGSPFPMETALHYVLEFAESPTKFSGESPKSAK